MIFLWGCASPVRAALFPQVLLVFGLPFSLYIGVPLCLLKFSASASVCLSVGLSLSVCVCRFFST